MKSKDGKSEKEEQKREDQRRERVARKGRKVAKHRVFPMGAESRKVGSLKRRVRSHLARWEMKNCTPPLWREAHFEVNMYNTHHSRTTFLEVEMSKKCTPLWREAHVEVKMYKTHQGFGPLLDIQMSFRAASARDFASSQKWAKSEGFVAFPKTMAGVYKKNVHQRCYRRSWFPETGCILEHQICSFSKIILRDRCSTSYDLASIFRGRRSTLDKWSGKITKSIGTRLSALHSTFDFWRKSRRIACFWSC